MIETLGDDALSLAEGTAEGLDAAGAVLWEATKETVFWAAERVLRQALAPVHEYRTSAKRVQAALDAQLAALPPRKEEKGKEGKEDSSSVEKGVRQIVPVMSCPSDVAPITCKRRRTRDLKVSKQQQLRLRVRRQECQRRVLLPSCAVFLFSHSCPSRELWKANRVPLCW